MNVGRELCSGCFTFVAFILLWALLSSTEEGSLGYCVLHTAVYLNINTTRYVEATRGLCPLFCGFAMTFGKAWCLEEERPSLRCVKVLSNSPAKYGKDSV